MHARLNEFRIAMMLLTRLPMGTIKGNVPGLAQSRWAYPLVGVLVGLAVWLVWSFATSVGFSPLLAAFLTLTGLVLLTGALHQDGLADLADGLGGGRDCAHCLDIMRDSRVGSYGVVALVLCLGAWVFAVFETNPSLTQFIAVGAVSRFAMLCLLDLLPPARDDGLGQSASAKPGAPLAVGAAITLAALMPLGLQALFVIAAAGLMGLVVAWRAKKRIGGQTGDVLGATQFLTETACWMALTLV
ncbi:MAG: adenosylcobinamide-GDP ribazoletransferase [Pelagimonas sp.]|jgi:adenosylcobinamide-GDP ribazoletransferase|nr:adenosylcobinamide-GDP ribazoletransferase [Pelagimonas sp.]